MGLRCLCPKRWKGGREHSSLLDLRQKVHELLGEHHVNNEHSSENACYVSE